MPKFLLTVSQKRSRASFKELALENKKVVKFFRMKNEGSYAINTNELIQELEDAHLARKYRNFKTNEFIKSAQLKLIEWTGEIERNRGRCVSIKLDCTKVQQQLDQQIKDMRNYLLSNYAEELRQEHNTLKDKISAINSLLEPFIKLLSKLDTVIKICDIIMDDLNKSHFAKESMRKILEMEYGNMSS